MKKTVKGEVTVFLSLIFLLLLSLTGAVLESASLQVLKNEKYTEAVQSLESVFAEYQRELMNTYHIFGVESSYGTGEASVHNILNRLAFYGAENNGTDVTRIRYLTDQNGAAFYQQAVRYISQWAGGDQAAGLEEERAEWERQMDTAREYEKEDTETSNALNHLEQENGQALPQEENPIQAAQKLKTGNFLNRILPESFVLSEKVTNLAELPSHRENQKGKGDFQKQEAPLSAVFFNLYLMQHFTSAVDGQTKNGFQYALEYLLEGTGNEAVNLERVLKKLVWLRMVPNYGYLLTDQERKTEADTTALILCTLFTVPQAAEIVSQAILLAWAYGESVVDVRTLLSGKKVPTVKSRESWELSLGELLLLGAGGNIPEAKNEESGLGYRTYLQMLLLFEKKETLSMRALDLIEMEIKSQENLEFFQTDYCVDAMEVHYSCSLRRGVIYQFTTSYHYR